MKIVDLLSKMNMREIEIRIYRFHWCDCDFKKSYSDEILDPIKYEDIPVDKLNRLTDLEVEYFYIKLEDNYHLCLHICVM